MFKMFNEFWAKMECTVNITQEDIRTEMRKAQTEMSEQKTWQENEKFIGRCYKQSNNSCWGLNQWAWRKSTENLQTTEDREKNLKINIEMGSIQKKQHKTHWCLMEPERELLWKRNSHHCLKIPTIGEQIHSHLGPS